MCHSNNVVIYTVVFGPVWHIQLRNHTIEAIYNWLKCIMCHSNNVVIYRVVFGPERIDIFS